MRKVLSVLLTIAMLLACTFAAAAIEVSTVPAQTPAADEGAASSLASHARGIADRLGKAGLRLDWPNVRTQADPTSSEIVGSDITIYSVPIFEIRPGQDKAGSAGALVAVEVNGDINGVTLYLLPEYASLATSFDSACTVAVISPGVKAATEPYDWTHVYTYVFQSGVYYIVGFSFGAGVGTAVGIIFVIIDGFEDPNGNIYETTTYYYGPPEYVIMPNGTIAYL